MKRVTRVTVHIRCYVKCPGWLGIKTGKGFFEYDLGGKEVLPDSEKEAAGKKK